MMDMHKQMMHKMKGGIGSDTKMTCPMMKKDAGEGSDTKSSE